MRLASKILVVAGTAIALVAAGGAEPLMSQVEELPYVVERSEGAIELRSYPPMIVAEIVVRGRRRAAIGQGFQTIAGYIFGANVGSRKIAMTAPVLQEPGVGSTMSGTTVPLDETAWRVRFVMPKTWTLQTLPKPTDRHVNLKALPATTMAVIRFSGLARDASIQEKSAELSAFMAKNKLKPIGTRILAFFNPPWTLPFLRRNEVMAEVEKP